MFRLLVIVLIVVPALEIWGLFAVGKLIGGWQTFALIVLTGLLGAALARREGRRVLEFARYQMSVGQPPGDSILDAICVFGGGLLLLMPGFLTDAFGLVLLLPVTRPFFKAWILAWIRKKLDSGQFHFIWRR